MGDDGSASRVSNSLEVRQRPEQPVPESGAVLQPARRDEITRQVQKLMVPFPKDKAGAAPSTTWLKQDPGFVQAGGSRCSWGG